MSRQDTSPPLAPQTKDTQATIAVDLTGKDAAWAQARAAREGITLSAVVAEAVRKARQHEAWAAFRDAVLEGQQPLTDDERATIEREWRW